MLDLIRKRQKSVIIKFIFWAIIATFVGTIFLVWGKGEYGAQDSTAAATVNGVRIDYEDYQRTYGNLYRLYQDMYRELFTPAMERELGLRRQALEMLIDETLLVQEAQRRKLNVSRQELIDSIARIPVFQENGVFNRDRYIQILAAQRITPEAFETTQRRQLLVEKVRRQLQDAVTVTAEEVEQEYRNRSEQVNLSFLRLTPARFEAKVSVTEPKLQEYFDAHREEFRLPETISLQYVVFDPASYQDQVSPSAEDLEKFYRRHIDRFEIPEQVKAAHILIRVDQEASEATRQKKREEARGLLDKIRSGADFADMARRHSADAASAAKGGDLGYFPRGTMVPSFEQAAFALRPGEISDIVESPFGFHIIKAEARIEAGVRPLSEVADEVQDAVRAEGARQLAFEKALDAYNMNRKGGSLESAAQSAGLQVRETAFFDRQSVPGGPVGAPEIVSAAFSLEAGELGRPVSRPEGVVLYALKERRESRLPELAEVRADVESAFRRAEAQALARQAAQKALEELKQGRPLPQVARDLGVKPEETGMFSRANGSFIPRLGSIEELSEAAFALTSKEPVPGKVFEQDGLFIVAALKERREADMSGLDATTLEALRQDLLVRKRGDALEKQIEELRENARITIAPIVASSLEGEKG